MKRPPTLKQIQCWCDDWNSKHRPGVEVIYHPVIGEAAGLLTKTTGEAYVLGGHTAVVFVEGVSGCVALRAVREVEKL